MIWSKSAGWNDCVYMHISTGNAWGFDYDLGHDHGVMTLLVQPIIPVQFMISIWEGWRIQSKRRGRIARRAAEEVLSDWSRIDGVDYKLLSDWSVHGL